MTRRQYKQDPVVVRRLRRKLELAGKCILSSITGRGRTKHGPPVKGRKKCQRCIDVHAGTNYKSAELAGTRKPVHVPVVFKRYLEIEVPIAPFPIQIVASFLIEGGL